MRTRARKWFVLAVICLGGGIVYVLPYLQYSYYDSMRAFLRLGHAQMGALVSVYGLLNLPAYVLGGILADRVSYRLLLSTSLVVGGLSGVWLATSPPFASLIVIHAIWSFATVFTYWPAMIRAVKLLGGSEEQGRLFGLREAGFGLAALIYSSAGLLIFRRAAEPLPSVLLFFSGVYLLAGGLSFLLLPRDHAPVTKAEPSAVAALGAVARRPAIWVAGLVIFCAYAISAGMGRLSPYLTQVLRLGAAGGALFGIIRTYAVPYVGCVAGGVVVDRIRSVTTYLIVAFAASALLLALLVLTPGRPERLVAVVSIGLAASLVVFTIRGVYFVPLDEARISPAHLGAAAGLLSVIGYLPDTFLLALQGRLLDAQPGALETAFKTFFLLLIGLAIAGLAATIVLRRLLTARTR